MAKRGCGLGVVSEPWRVPPNHPCWATDDTGSAAVMWRDTLHSPPCSMSERGKGYVVVRWGLVSVMSIYAPPRWSQAEFEGVLHDMHASARRHLLMSPGGIIVAGDFNAKNPLWGSPAADQRGHTLEGWASGLGLVLINTGQASTFLCRRGRSIVDLTWASPPAARRIGHWEVVIERETLSDHRHIEMVVNAASREVLARRRELEASR
ncbi:uncharacterized protein [Temnothorax nylanderi]|uniref:uncharacterized protein n=1 Tax=Temnothorax nylanderi TaxID=102681 RepID=UPI003A89A94D